MNGTLPGQLLGAAVRLGPPEIAGWKPSVDFRPWADARLAADRRRAVFGVDGVATYGVTGGDSVTVDPAPGSDPHKVDAFLHGTVTALLLAQRGRFALHANAVGSDRAVLVAGRRGAGKSTTAAALVRRGHPHITDDLCVLDPGDAGTWLHPTARGLRLADAAAGSLGFDTTAATGAAGEAGKLVLLAGEAKPVRVGAAFFLRTGEVEKVAVSQVTGARAVALVIDHTYRGGLLNLIHADELFTWAARIAQTVPVHTVTRPHGDWTAAQVARAIEPSL